jgi:predicted nucleic acid-binding protein
MNKILIDSTIWIEFFRGNNDAVNDFILPLVEKDKIYYNGIILSELLIGASNQKEFSFLENNFKGFRYLETDEKMFSKAAQMGFKLRRKGLTIPLSDLMIAAQALHHDLMLATADPHFNLVNEKIKLNLEFFRL